MSRRRSPGLGSILNLAKPESGTWYRFENIASQPDCTDLYIYDEIGGWGVYSTDLIRELMQVTTDRIRVRVNSPGGDVFEGLAIHNALSIHTSHVETYVEGHAASAANFIALAGNDRVYSRYAMGMAHNPSSGMWGESRDLRKMADLLDKVRDQLVKLYSEATGGDAAEWQRMLDEETWFTADEALKFGLATRIDESNTERPSNRWNLKGVYRFGSRDEAPAPVRQRRAPAVVNVNTAPVSAVPPAPGVPPIPDPAPTTPVPLSQSEIEAPEQDSAYVGPTFTFDADAFRVAVKIAADPAVPTDQAPFEWDPDVFRAILRDKTLTAPAVVSKPVGAPAPTEFKDQFDPDLFRQAVIEGVSK